MLGKPLNEEEHEKLLEAQFESLVNRDEFLAGTKTLTSEWGWWVLEGIAIRDESGLEESILRGQAEGQS